MALLEGGLYNLQFRGQPIHASWKTIYIRTGCDGPSDRTDVAWTIFKTPSSNQSFPIPFRLSRSVIKSLFALGLRMNLKTRIRRASSVQAQPQVWYSFFDEVNMETIEIRLGVCSIVSDRHCFWADVQEWHRDTCSLRKRHSGHDCATDHIADWPNRTRVFGDELEERWVTLWFVDCPHTPGTVVFHIHLGGHVYDEMLREANIAFPSPPSAVRPTSTVEGKATSSSPRTLSPSAETVDLHELVLGSPDEPEFSLVSRFCRVGVRL